MEALTAYLLLAGNAYLEAVIAKDEPLELYLLRPDRVKIIPGTTGVPEAFEYSLNGHAVRIAVDPLNGQSRVLHIKTFNPLHDWYGMSPIEAAAHAIDQHNAVASHNLSLLQNGGRPSGALQFRPGHDGELLSEKQRQDLRQDLLSAVEGASNSGRILILEGDFQWKEMGLSPKDLDFIEGKYLSRSWSVAGESQEASMRKPLTLIILISSFIGPALNASFKDYAKERQKQSKDTTKTTSPSKRWSTPSRR